MSPSPLINSPTPKDRLIVALDFPDLGAAGALVSHLGSSVTFYKIGLELIMQGGLSFIEHLRADGKRVFLDMKLLDIPNTVEKATANAAETGAEFLTIHALDTKTIEAAAKGAAGSNLKVLGVTVLTSLDDQDLREQHINTKTEHLVTHRANLPRRRAATASSPQARKQATSVLQQAKAFSSSRPAFACLAATPATKPASPPPTAQ